MLLSLCCASRYCLLKWFSVGWSSDRLAGPLLDEEGILYADLDMDDIGRMKFDFDVTGHYARPDVFHLEVNEAPLAPVWVSGPEPESMDLFEDLLEDDERRIQEAHAEHCGHECTAECGSELGTGVPAA